MARSKNNAPKSLSRRTMLQSVGTAGVGALAAVAAVSPGQALAASGGTAISGFYDVTQAPYGATGNGITNDAPAIQAAINAAATGNRGGLVWVPPGVYRLGSAITIPAAVTLAGAGWGTPNQESAGYPSNLPGNGSWFAVDNTSFVPITVNGRGTTIRDVAFAHTQPTNVTASYAPLPYPHAIAVRVDDVRLENIFLRNPTRGITINAGGGAIGRVTLNRIWGQPLLEGIRIDNALDVIKVDNVHFWPFWSSHVNVMNYQKNYAVAIASYRNDNPHFSNIFVYGYLVGFLFGSSGAGVTTGVTSKFRLSNVDTDICNIGIHITGAGTTGQVVNFTAQGYNLAAGGIVAQAPNVRLQCSNIRVTDVRNNAIRSEGSGTLFIIDNVLIDSWNTAGVGFPAIEAFSPSTIYLGRGRAFFGSGPQVGGGVVLDN